MNREQREVTSTLDVLTAVQPNDELMLVVEREGQGGGYAQAAGSVTSGFVVWHRDAAGNDHTTANHELRLSTVVAMLDKSAANEQAWTGTVTWVDGSGPGRASAAVVRSLLAGALAVVVAIVGVSQARTYGTVCYYLCGRDGDEVASASPEWGSRWGSSSSSTCTFIDGERVELASGVGNSVDLVESIRTTAVVFALAVGLWVRTAGGCP